MSDLYCIYYATIFFNKNKKNDTRKLSRGMDKDYLDTNSGPTVDQTRLPEKDDRKNRHPLPHKLRITDGEWGGGGGGAENEFYL